MIGNSMVITKDLQYWKLSSNLPLAKICGQIIAIVMEFNFIEYFHILYSLNLEVDLKVNE
jgi:hypothetical protein